MATLERFFVLLPLVRADYAQPEKARASCYQKIQCECLLTFRPGAYHTQSAWASAAARPGNGADVGSRDRDSRHQRSLRSQ